MRTRLLKLRLLFMRLIEIVVKNRKIVLAIQVHMCLLGLNHWVHSVGGIGAKFHAGHGFQAVVFTLHIHQIGIH